MQAKIFNILAVATENTSSEGRQIKLPLKEKARYMYHSGLNWTAFDVKISVKMS